MTTRTRTSRAPQRSDVGTDVSPRTRRRRRHGIARPGIFPGRGLPEPRRASLPEPTDLDQELITLLDSSRRRR